MLLYVESLTSCSSAVALCPYVLETMTIITISAKTTDFAGIRASCPYSVRAKSYSIQQKQSI
jgi:hypothetical protein